MKPIIAQVWKESRETAKWMVVGLLAMSAGVVCALHSQINYQSYDVRGGLSVMSSMFLTITTFGSAIVAIMLGLAQTLPESRGDKWGFLAHRPVRRSTLFAAKVLVGLVMYLLATGIPVLCAVWWVATPGHLAVPFEGRMTLPAIADLLCGSVYYFAAVMTGMREARWYGSRALPIVAVVICSLLLQLPHFWEAALWCVAGAMVLGTAAWGTFITGGRDATQPIVARIATSFTIFAGLCIIAIVGTGIILALLPAQPTNFRFQRYVITHEGVLARVDTDGQIILAVNDMHGVPIPQYLSTATHSWETISAGVTVRYLQIDHDAAGLSASYRDFTRFIPFQLGGFGYGSTKWYFVKDADLAAEYDANSARLIGWLGPDGFTSGPTPPAHRFNGPVLSDPENWKDPILAFGNAVYRLHLADHRTEQLFSPPAGETVISAAQESEDASTLALYGSRAQFDAFLTDQNIYLQDSQHALVMKIPLAGPAMKYSEIEVTRALAAKNLPTFVGYWPSFPYRASDRVQYVGLGLDGVPFEHDSVPPNWTPQPPTTGELVVPSAVFPVSVPVVEKFDSWFGNGMQARPSVSTQHWSLAAGLLSALACALIMFIRTRAFGYGGMLTAIWIVLALLAGPVALMLIWSMAERPPLEKCPACGRMSIASQDRCTHCTAAYASPPMNGTEIFEPELVKNFAVLT